MSYKFAHKTFNIKDYMWTPYFHNKALTTKEEVVNAIKNYVIQPYTSKLLFKALYDVELQELDENGRPTSVYRNIGDELLPGDIKIDSLFDVNDDDKTKASVASFIFSYYLSKNNYTKALDILSKFTKTKREYSFVLNQDPYGALIILYGTLNKNIKIAAIKDPLLVYSSFLKQAAKSNTLNEYLTNKTFLTMHTAVVKKFGKKLEPNSFSSFMESNNILDLLESKPSEIENLLSYFSSDFSWISIKDRKDYRIRKNIITIDSEKSRFVEILKNYLYSKFSSCKSTTAVEKALQSISIMLNVFEYSNEISIMDIVEDLPEKIKTAAVKIMVDF